jgi:uncharacterized protein YbjT (DUF2867 family)
LSTVLAEPSFSAAHAFTRRALAQSSPKLHAIESTDPAKDWPASFPTNIQLFLSALGTTRGQAGGLAAQRLVDYDLNLALAKSAKAAGVGTYVLVSSSGASSGSHFPYMRLKGELEDAVKGLEFEHLVILRPGLLRGQREQPRLGERIFSAGITLAGKIGGKSVEDGLAQDAEVVARAAVSAGLKCVKGEHEKGVWELGQKEIVKLGRDEWKSAAEE